MKRLFFSINPNEKESSFIKSVLDEKKELFPEGCVKWIREEDIHMTLLFLGVVKEEKKENLFLAAQKATKEINPFTVNFNKVCYHPQKGLPKIIWIEGERCKKLETLREKLINFLKEENMKFINEDRFLPHVTLGRVKSWEIKKMEEEEVPQVNEDLSFSVNVNSMFLMESVLRKGSPDYKKVNCFSL